MASDGENRAQWAGIKFGLLVLPVALVFSYMGQGDLGRSLAIALVSILFAIRFRWDLRRHVWFWGTIALVLVLESPLFFLIRWPEGWTPAVIILPFAVVEFIVIVKAVQLAEHVMAKVWK
ncbi:MAG TPA: hypothetical protein VF737_01475 [Gemmatimonadaceae bacterium]